MSWDIKAFNYLRETEKEQGKMETKILKIKDLNFAKYNPRKTLESKSKQYEMLKKSLSKYGTVVPIIVNFRNNTVVGGHQRLNVLKELGKEEVEAVVVDLNETQEKQLNIALNKIEGRWDNQKLNELLETMTDKELEFTGFIDENMPKAAQERTSKGQKEQSEAGFEIYISFPTADIANDLLKEHKIKYALKDGERSVTIRMEE